MTDSAQSMTINEYIEQVKQKDKIRHIDLNDYIDQIQAMIDNGLSANRIHGWFKQNKMPISYMRVRLFVRELLTNNRPSPSGICTPRAPLQDSAKKTATTLKNVDIEKLPSLYDDIE